MAQSNSASNADNFRIVQLEQRVAELEATCKDSLLKQVMVDNALAIMFIKGRDLRYIETNKAYADLMGKTREEIIGATAYDLFPPETARTLEKEDEAVISTGVASYRETTLPINDDICSFNTAKIPLFDDNGKATGICFFGVNITDQKKALLALSNKNEQLQGILDHAESIIHVMNGAGQFVLASREAERYWNITTSNIAGKRYSDVFPADVAKTLQDRNEEVLRTGKTWRGEIQMQSDDGIRTFIAAKFPLTDHRNQPYAVGTIATDISELKDAENVLQKSYALVEKTVAERTAELHESNSQLKMEIHERRLVENALRENVNHFRTLFDLAPDAVFLQSQDGRIMDCNKAAERVSGYTRSELLSLRAHDLLPDDILPLLAADCCGEHDSRFIESVNRRKDGSIFPVEVILRNVELSGQIASLVVVRDITERQQAEKQLKLFEKVFAHALEGITITDAEGTILAVNDAFTLITGYSSDEAIGENPRILKSDRHTSTFYSDMWKQLVENGSWEGEIWNRRKSGEAYPEWLSISAIRNDHGDVINYVAVFHDITEMKQKEQQIQHQAYHDALTGLPNRLLLMDRLSVAVSHARRMERKVAILFIDLDNFKNINDSFGHATGDKYLQVVASEISGLMREDDTVARLGGDEFVIMLEDIEDEREVVYVADRLLNHFRTPVSVPPHDLFVGMSIGITFFPDDGDSPDALIKNADLAMYRAKDEGRNQYRMFTTLMNDRVLERLTMESNMRHALDSEEFTLYYQPKVDMRTAEITGMEALMRWIRPDGTIVSPGEFIPVAEESGLIIRLGERALEQACRDTKKLVENGHPELRCSVNLSAQQFRQPGLVTLVENTLGRHKLHPRHLELEITETTLMKDVPQTVQKLQLLSDMGVTLSIDDFGSGYSSLYYLKHFPIDLLKIDQAFIRDIPRDPNDAAIVSTVISMAEHLNLRVIAEGVETQSQLAFLLLQGCDEIQGYLFGRPMPLPVFTSFIANPPRFDAQAE